MTHRKPLIAGNWKMYKTVPEAVETAQSLVAAISAEPKVDIMIAPSFTCLYAVHQIIKDSTVGLGAQDLYWEAEGAFTGEISAPMLVSSGCHYVIIGHSERRQYFGETDEAINKKIAAALQNNLIPVFCVGETDGQREANQTFSVLDKQMEKGLEGFSSNGIQSLVLAYEPVWAIGTGKTATKQQAQEVHEYLRQWLEKSFGNDLAKNIRILYGGSVKPGNIQDLMEMPDVDGALVGGASLEADMFTQIIQYEN